MLALYRAMLSLRKSETVLNGESFAWAEAGLPEDVLAFSRGPHFHCVVNFGASSLPLPAGSAVLLASAGLDGRSLPPDTAAWLRV
jgi:alpha-glucosidase